MSRIDWQAYIDGSLSAEALAVAEAALASDPGAVAELEGLKQFRSAVKSVGIAESVPIVGLQKLLKAVIRENRVPWYARPSYYLPAAVAACVLVVGLLVFNPFGSEKILSGSGEDLVASSAPRAMNETADLRQSPFQAATDVTDPQLAAAWLSSKVRYDAPRISLASLPGASLDGAECGQCWIAYKMSYRGEKYVLYGRHESGRSFSGPVVSEEECKSRMTMYKLSDGIAWRGPNEMSYVLKGGSLEGQLALAEAASGETADLVHAF